MINKKKKRCVIFFFIIITLTSCTPGDAPIVESTVDTSLFDGNYLLAEVASFDPLMDEIERTEDDERRKALEEILSSEIARYSDFSIEHGIIRSGRSIIEEFSLISGVTEGNSFSGKAIWHEDVQDPGDSIEVFVELSIEDDILHFTYGESEAECSDSIVLIRDFREQ